jgi:hypothetical protein
MPITEDLKLECLRLACALFQAGENKSRDTTDVLADAQKIYTWVKEKQDVQQEN